MEAQPVNKNRTIWTVVAVILLALCCCVIVAAVGFYAFTTISSSTISTAQPNEAVAPQDIPDLSAPPTGGLGNDILRQDTWQVMAPAAVGLGCDQPLPAASTIEVLQQPDAAGYWVEQWTVVCNSGDSYAFNVEFTQDSTGTTFNIKSLP